MVFRLIRTFALVLAVFGKNNRFGDFSEKVNLRTSGRKFQFRVKPTLGTAACRVKPLMSDWEALVAVSVTAKEESDCCSQLSVKVTPSFSYTVAEGAVEKCRQS